MSDEERIADGLAQPMEQCPDCGGRLVVHAGRDEDEDGYAHTPGCRTRIPPSARALHPEAAIAYARVVKFGLQHLAAEGLDEKTLAVGMMISFVRLKVEGSLPRIDPRDDVRWANGFVELWKDQL